MEDEGGTCTAMLGLSLVVDNNVAFVLDKWERISSHAIPVQRVGALAASPTVWDPQWHCRPLVPRLDASSLSTPDPRTPPLLPSLSPSSSLCPHHPLFPTHWSDPSKPASSAALSLTASASSPACRSSCSTATSWKVPSPHPTPPCRSCR